MHTSVVKYAIVVILVVVNAGTWWYASSIYREHKADIYLALEAIARELALPFHIAQMYIKEPVEELPVPVHDVLLEDIGDTWGAARDEGRTHEGTDIFAPRGTPVFSATEGYVIRQNIGMRGGRNIMVFGPGGLMYYYAHFDRIADGMERGVYVTPDTVLGFVGNSGNATGTPPHLHFGIYPQRWDAINPYPMLVNRWD